MLLSAWLSVQYELQGQLHPLVLGVLLAAAALLHPVTLEFEELLETCSLE